MPNTTKHPIVSKKVFIPFILITSLFALWGIANDLNIINVPYIVIGILALIIMAKIIVVKFPKLELEDKISLSYTFKKISKNKSYLMGVVAQIFYVGLQIMCWTFIFQYVDNLNAKFPESAQLTVTWFNLTAILLFLSGRWLGIILMKRHNPSKVLLLFGIGSLVTTAIIVFVDSYIGLYGLVATSIFMSIMFSTIYGISLKNMGDEAKIDSAGFNDSKILGYIPKVNLLFILLLIFLLVVAILGYKT